MTPALIINQLHHYFDEGTVNEAHILRGINLTIHPGEFVTIIGGNGAGKSTLLNSIAGTLATKHGSIQLSGQDITGDSVTKRAPKISRVFQDPKLGTAVRLTVEENLALAMKRGKKRSLRAGINAKDRAFFKEQLAQLDMGLEDWLSTEIGRLSGGQRQAITLLMATLQRPDLILLDEHTAALDPKTSQVVMQLTQRLIQTQQLTAFMITHNLEDALHYGNRLLMLHQGQLVVDLSQQEKEQMTVPMLLDLFQENSHTPLHDAQLL